MANTLLGNRKPFPDQLMTAMSKSGSGRLLGATQAYKEIASRDIARERNRTARAIAGERIGAYKERTDLTSQKAVKEMRFREYQLYYNNLSKQNIASMKGNFGVGVIDPLSFDEWEAKTYGAKRPTSQTPVTEEQPISEEEPMPELTQQTPGLRTSGGLLSGMGKAFGGALKSMMGMPLPQQGGAMLGAQTARRMPSKEELDKIVGNIPEPELIENENMPKVDDLIQTLEEYDDVNEAINDLDELDREYHENGLDLASQANIDKLLSAFTRKFGDEATRRLIEIISRRR